MAERRDKKPGAVVPLKEGSGAEQASLFDDEQPAQFSCEEVCETPPLPVTPTAVSLAAETLAPISTGAKIMTTALANDAVATMARTESDGERRMGLGEHLAELRARLLLCLVAFGAVFLLGLAFYPYLWRIVLLPATQASAWLGRDAHAVGIQWLGPMDGFNAVVEIDLLLTLALLHPLFVWEAWAFVAPGLTARERRALGLILTAGTGLFLAGALTAFFLASEIGLQFLLYFNETLEFSRNDWTWDSYFGFVKMVCVGFGLAFETPLAMMALAWAGLVRPESIARYWRHAVLATVVLGAIFTPPDPLTQIMLAALLCGLYLLGYLLARAVAGKRGGPSSG